MALSGSTKPPEIATSRAAEPQSPLLARSPKPKTPERDVKQSCNPALEDEEGTYNEDPTLMERVRGDAVGSTLYSRRFILKTIFSLSKEPDSNAEREQLERDLCSVWDMTIELDVVRFLLAEDTLPILVHIISTTSDLRYIEILVGIIGNMCCHECGFDALTKDAATVEILLKLINCMDTQILLQLMRLLETAMSKLKTNNLESSLVWYQYFSLFDDLIGEFSFILKMSKVESLLKSTLKALNAITAKCAILADNQEDVAGTEKITKFIDAFLSDELIEAINMAFSYLLEECVESSTDKYEDDDASQQCALKTTSAGEIMEIYINVHSIYVQYEGARKYYEAHATEVLSCMSLILMPLTDATFFLPLSERSVFFIEGVLHIANGLGQPFNDKFFVSVFKVWQLLKSRKPSNEVNDFESNSSDVPAKTYASNAEALLQSLTCMLNHSTRAELKRAFAKVERAQIDILLKALDSAEDDEQFCMAACNLRNALSPSALTTASLA